MRSMIQAAANVTWTSQAGGEAPHLLGLAGQHRVHMSARVCNVRAQQRMGYWVLIQLSVDLKTSLAESSTLALKIP